MKTFKEYLQEQPTNRTGNAIATFDPFLFPQNMDLLDQGYQTPGESGLAKWRFSNVYPVMHVTLDDNDGDGPSIDSMVAASKEFTDLMDRNTQKYVKKRFAKFMEEAYNEKKCPPGKYFCTKEKKCMPIPSGMRIGYGGWLEPKKNGKNGKNGNGNGNGSHNGNGGSNGNGGGHSGGNGNGGGGGNGG